ncbi:MAG: Chromosome partition protein Smc, partial [Pseudomonadota bacterium]
IRLEQTNRRAELAKNRIAADTALKTATTALTAARTALDDAITQERDARQSLRLLETDLNAARSALETLERAHLDITTRLAALDEAHASANEALAEARERAEECDITLDGLPDISEFEERLTEALEDASEKRSSVADARAELARLMDAQQRRTERRSAIDEEIARLDQREKASNAQRDDLAQRLEAAFAELEELAQMPDVFAERREELVTALHDAEEGRKRAADAIVDADKAHRDAQTVLRDAQSKYLVEREAKARLEATLEAARARRVAAAQRIAETFQVEPQACLALSQHAADAELPDIGDIERSLARLKADREKLGGVNLAADSELEAIEKSHTDLDKERADVEEAIAKLRNGIGQLNREARQRLRAAFEQVNAHFQQLFTTLFSGGEARLEMIESPDDPLDGGLEIIAKPPGKKPATLSLLSGGEQTLTALSLIFAVFLTNPSPICVLDEVDAPLDDANVDRFCTMMEKMAADTATRFLVITHHPMTMSRMNRLFGVTMAEKGVSQLVSVDLEAARRFVEADAA